MKEKFNGFFDPNDIPSPLNAAFVALGAGFVAFLYNMGLGIVMLVTLQVTIGMLTILLILKPINKLKKTNEEKSEIVKKIGFFSLIVPGTGQLILNYKIRGLAIMLIGISLEILYLILNENILLNSALITYFMLNVIDTDLKAIDYRKNKLKTI